jgi:LacI family repressor for deo operon, udp, cdd, tsx, nupC, and nupG
MLACLKGEARDADTVLPVELILRASTGPAPA